MSRVTVEDGGTVLRGLAVPFNQLAPILTDGEIFAEVFDRDSLVELPRDVPLLLSHNRNHPAIGKVLNSWVDAAGLHIEARLVGSTEELAGWRARLKEGLTSALSIGFTGRHKFERPTRPGALTVGRVRNAKVVETSLVNWGAYDSAQVERLSVRTAMGDFEHRQSVRIMAEAQQQSAEITAYLNRHKKAKALYTP
jgi:HK97 family phage prohead protease